LRSFLDTDLIFDGDTHGTPFHRRDL